MSEDAPFVRDRRRDWSAMSAGPAPFRFRAVAGELAGPAG